MITVALGVVIIAIYTTSRDQSALPATNATMEQPILASQAISTLTKPLTLSSHKNLATPQLPASLHGLPAPDFLDIDEHGELVINDKILSLFEFYMSGLGEETLTIVTWRINDFMAKTLVSPALAQAQEIFEHYLNYLNHLTMHNSEAEQASTSLATLTLAKGDLLALREQFFSEQVIHAFWGKHIEYEKFMLALAAIKRDKLTTNAEKDLAIDNLNQLTPHWLVSQQVTANQLNDYRVQSHILTHPHERHELAIEQFGEAAAIRLEQLTNQRKHWQQRIDLYRTELDQLVALQLTNDEFEQQTKILRNMHFNQQENKRINALDATYLNQFHDPTRH